MKLWDLETEEQMKNQVFIIAEGGVNHNGDLNTAKRLVAAAAECGCNAVKFQTFRADRVVSRYAEKCDYQIDAAGSWESQFDMIRKLELDEHAHIELMRVAGDEGIEFISTPFDEQSASLLAGLGIRYMKIPSGEITNTPFLGHVARLQRPIILSTGMSYLSEVDVAVRSIQDTWDGEEPIGELPPLILLHCLTQYPAPVEEINLRAMVTLRESFRVPVGYSDHTTGIEVALAAVALGAKVIEKHFTLDRGMPGPDHRASMEPDGLKGLVRKIRNIETALGDGGKVPAESERKNRKLLRKSLVVTRDLEAGHRITTEDLLAKRPGNGIDPAHTALVVGSALREGVGRDVSLSWEHLLKRQPT